MDSTNRVIFIPEALSKEELHDRAMAAYEAVITHTSIRSRYNLAKLVGKTRQTVYQWKVVPVRHVPRIVDLTGMTREQLRPDIFGVGHA